MSAWTVADVLFCMKTCGHVCHSCKGTFTYVHHTHTGHFKGIIVGNKYIVDRVCNITCEASTQGHENKI